MPGVVNTTGMRGMKKMGTEHEICGDAPVLAAGASDMREVGTSLSGGDGECRSPDAITSAVRGPSIGASIDGGNASTIVPGEPAASGLSALAGKPLDPNDEDFMMFGFGC
jgi:hypothetical protein